MGGGNRKECCLSLVSCHRDAKVKPQKQASKTWSAPIRSLLATCSAFYLESENINLCATTTTKSIFFNLKEHLHQLGHLGNHSLSGNAWYHKRTCHFCRLVCILWRHRCGTILGLDPRKEDAFIILVRDACWNYSMSHHQSKSINTPVFKEPVTLNKERWKDLGMWNQAHVSWLCIDSTQGPWNFFNLREHSVQSTT